VAVARALSHLRVARVYLWAGLVYLAIGGGLALLIRWQWAYPGKPVPLFGGLLFPYTQGAITPDSYQALFTMHGLVMIFFAVTPILIGALSHWLVPAMIGARGLAYPRAAWVGVVFLLAAQAVALASFFVELGTARSGWTLYPPLSTIAPGHGQTLVVAALGLASISTVIGAVNVLVTVIRRRAPGMTWGRLPLTVWGLFFTAVLNAAFTPVLIATALLLLSDRLLGTEVFLAGALAQRGGGDPFAFQHLFWIFGHPEVYILILPVWGVVSDFVAFFTRRAAFWYRGTVGSMLAVTLLAGLVYGHHIFTTGIAPMLGAVFETLTLAISIPSTILFGNWLMTLWQGRVRLTVPMLYVTGVLLVFAAGGLTGLYLGAVATDIVLHDTLFVVGHFHLTMAAATFLGIFAALHHWAPKLLGCRLGDRLGAWHAVLTLLGLFLVFGGLIVAGLQGQHRRLYDPFVASVEHLANRSANRHTSFSAFGLATVQLLFVLNLIHSLLTRRVAVENPWQVGTLEWKEPDLEQQVMRGPHEFLSGDDEKSAGKDYLDQGEACPQKSAPDAK
jgi:cytochrome c oxidase subunit I